MNKAYVILILAFCTLTFQTTAQSWQPVGSGCGTNDQTNAVRALTVYNNQLVAAGTFSSAGGSAANNIASWDGTSWHPLGQGIGASAGFQVVNALAVFQGDLYAAGTFSIAGGAPAASIAKWNGTSWTALGDGISQGGVQALAVIGGYLYAAGNFSDTINGQEVHLIERWDGSSWSHLPGSQAGDSLGGTWDIQGYIETLYPKGSRLYIGGRFIHRLDLGVTVFGGYNLAYWDTAGYLLGVKDTMSPFAPTIHYAGSPDFASVHQMTEYNGSIVFCGRFDTAGSAPTNDIASWDGYEMNSLPNPAGGPWEMFSPLFPYQGNLVTGTPSGSGVGTANYNGSAWILMGSPFTGTQPTITSFCEYNGALYVGGEFSQCGQTSMMNIAKWSSTNGIEQFKNEESASFYPNPASESVWMKGLHRYAEVSMMDAVGRKVMTTNADSNGNIQIDVSTLAPGMYFINEKKLVKE